MRQRSDKSATKLKGARDYTVLVLVCLCVCVRLHVFPFAAAAVTVIVCMWPERRTKSNQMYYAKCAGDNFHIIDNLAFN